MAINRFTILAYLLALLSVAPASHAKSQDDTWLQLTPEQLSQQLAWQKASTTNNICGGFYIDQPIVTPPNLTPKQTLIKSKRALLSRDKPSELIGDVKVTQIGKQVTGDRAISYVNKKTNKIEKLDIVGDVHLTQPGFLAVGNNAHVNLENRTGSLQQAIYRYQIAGQPRLSVYDKDGQLRQIEVKGSNYRGDAQRIDQTAPKHIVFHHTTFTTCNPYSKAWQIKSTTLKLDRDTGMGTAYNAFLYLHGIPVFYTPWLRFPINNKRKSGFLMPQYKFSQDSGITIATPYYLNLAPNYDMTVTPNFITKRGVKLDDLFRYLTPTSYGQIFVGYIPHDRVFADFQNQVAAGKKFPGVNSNGKSALAAASSNRYELAWQNKSIFNDYVQSNVNIDYVSDDYFLQDFPSAPLRSSSDFSDLLPTTQLTQDVDLTLNSLHWSADTNFENFQTLHPINIINPARDQYARLPDLNINGIYPDFFHNFNFDFNAEITNFAHPLFEQHYPTTLASVTGFRYNFYPQLNLYLAKAWGYFEPQVTLTKTFYDLTDPVQNTGNPALSQRNNMQRSVPIYDIDTGLYFDRSVDVGNTNYTQTLEPRLFYLNAPLVNQNDLPNFDSSLNASLTFDQMFNINRFQGFDRYGDANQLTLGLTSRLIKNTNGNDVLDMSVGQIRYFENRRVSLPGESATQLANDKEAVSPIVGQIAWQFLDAWNITGNAAYDTKEDNIHNASTSLRYTPDANHFLTAGTSYVRNASEIDPNAKNLNQINLGIVWPLNLHWHTIGGVVYNLTQSFAQSYLYGLQYNSCCWALRVIDARRFIGLDPNSKKPTYDPTVFLQFVLTGLASGGAGQGSSPNSLIDYTIPGYTDTFGQNPLMLAHKN